MREYALTTGGATVSGVTTLAVIRAAAAPAVNLEFLRFWVSQSAAATSAQQRIQLALNSGTVTATAQTPIKLKEQDGVSVITGSTTPGAGNCAINATAENARTVTLEDAFNVLNGWLMIPTPRETKIQPAGAASGFTMFFPVAPSVAVTGWAWGLHYGEV